MLSKRPERVLSKGASQMIVCTCGHENEVHNAMTSVTCGKCGVNLNWGLRKA